MGYFSNGDERRRYEAEFCDKCIHEPDPSKPGPMCGVWEAHEIAHEVGGDNADAYNALHALIPRFLDADGVTNRQCRMFVKREKFAPPIRPCQCGGMSIYAGANDEIKCGDCDRKLEIAK